jgi:hypothetical protein
MQHTGDDHKTMKSQQESGMTTPIQVFVSTLDTQG